MNTQKNIFVMRLILSYMIALLIGTPPSRGDITLYDTGSIPSHDQVTSVINLAFQVRIPIKEMAEQHGKLHKLFTFLSMLSLTVRLCRCWCGRVV